MFNVLSNCKTDKAIKVKGDTYYHGMSANERNYLLKLPDAVQYPAARCAMGQDVYMYGRSASSGVESMNRANKKDVRNHTAVDSLNAALRMIHIEAGRFESYKELAWKQTLPLTPRGMDEMEAVFSDVNPARGNRMMSQNQTLMMTVKPGGCRVCVGGDGGCMHDIYVLQGNNVGNN